MVSSRAFIWHGRVLENTFSTATSTPYSLALAQAIAREAGQHELWLALSGRFLDSIEPLRVAFSDLMPGDHIRVIGANRTSISEIIDRQQNHWSRGAILNGEKAA